MDDEDKIVGHLKMDYKEMSKGEYVLDDEGNPIVKKYELVLNRKHLSALKTLMMDKEKEVMMANLSNVREAQGKNKILKHIYQILGYE